MAKTRSMPPTIGNHQGMAAIWAWAAWTWASRSPVTGNWLVSMLDRTITLTSPTMASPPTSRMDSRPPWPTPYMSAFSQLLPSRRHRKR